MSDGGAVAEVGGIEQRMIERRHVVQRHHAEGRRQARPQDGPLVRGHDERRPGVERPPGDVQGIGDRPRSRSRARTWRPVPSTRRSGTPGARGWYGSRWLRRLLRPGRACSSPCAASRPGAPAAPPCTRSPGVSNSASKSVGSFTRRHSSISTPCCSSLLGLILASGSSMRTSFIGIMGRKRTNKTNRVVNRPSVPMNVM